MFRANPGDIGKTFEQVVRVEDAAGRKLIETNVAVFELKIDTHNIINQVMGIPIGDAGLKSIKCFLREKGQPVWDEIGNYPITVKWQTVQ